MAESTSSACMSPQIGNRLGDILPEEIWDRILSLVYDELQYEPHKFAALIPVNKTWASLAQPKLYSSIYICEDVREEGPGLLARFAGALFDVPVDHPKRTWVRRVELEMGAELDVASELRAYAAINDYVTIIFARSCRIQEVRLENSSYTLQTGPMAVLADSSRTSLVKLEMGIGNRTLTNLRLIPCFVNLRSLILYLDFEVESVYLPKHSPLRIPTVQNFELSSYIRQGSCSNILAYISGFTFAPTCKLCIRFPRTELASEDGKLLDPIFLAHESRAIILQIGGHFAHPTVLQRTQHLKLCILPPASMFHDANVLPSVLKLDVMDSKDIESLFAILDILATSTATFDTCIHISAHIIILRPTITTWYWHWIPKGAITDLDMRMTTRLLQLSQSLKPRGITLADFRGFTMDLPSMQDPRLAKPHF